MNAKVRVPCIGKKLNREGNRRERRLCNQIKTQRQRIARVNNELYRRKKQTKATRKEVRISQELRKYVEGGSAGTQELVEASEKWLDELRVKKVILLKAVEKRKRRKSNAMFATDEGVFYKKVNNTKEFKGEPPAMEKFVEFLGRHVGGGEDYY